jgi:hypothetical protein|tara:strand:+ start:570 stop:902 length:333 start_codon:yes stop_codon:yes gene_type:complete
MTKAKMDYLWAPKDEKLVSSLLDSLGFTGVGESGRYPTGVKYDCLVAICDVISTNEKTASMVASRTHQLQSERRATGKAPSVDSVVSALASGKMSEADLKKAMKKAGLLK